MEEKFILCEEVKKEASRFFYSGEKKIKDHIMKWSDHSFECFLREVERLESKVIPR